jgi:hypothetical protein
LHSDFEYEHWNHFYLYNTVFQFYLWRIFISNKNTIFVEYFSLQIKNHSTSSFIWFTFSLRDHTIFCCCTNIFLKKNITRSVEDSAWLAVFLKRFYGGKNILLYSQKGIGFHTGLKLHFFQCSSCPNFSVHVDVNMQNFFQICCFKNLSKSLEFLQHNKHEY